MFAFDVSYSLRADERTSSNGHTRDKGAFGAFITMDSIALAIDHVAMKSILAIV